MNPSTTPTPRTDAIQRITDYLLSGGLFNPELAIHDRVRDLLMDCRTELTELHNEVARLRKYVELIEIYSPENEWSLPEWRRLIGSREENEDPETLFNLYQFRFQPDIRAETNEVQKLQASVNKTTTNS